LKLRLQSLLNPREKGRERKKMKIFEKREDEKKDGTELVG